MLTVRGLEQISPVEVLYHITVYVVRTEKREQKHEL